MPELAPADGDVVVKKYRSSGFWGTNLDMLLRSNGIESVVITGCTTEGCVESTARDALFNDYYVVIVEDCVASDDRAQHEASLLLMRHRFDMAGSEEMLRVWSADTPQPRNHRLDGDLVVPDPDVISFARGIPSPDMSRWSNSRSARAGRGRARRGSRSTTARRGATSRCVSGSRPVTA